MEVTGITLFAAMGLQAALRGKPLNFRDYHISVVMIGVKLIKFLKKFKKYKFSL